MSGRGEGGGSPGDAPPRPDRAGDLLAWPLRRPVPALLAVFLGTGLLAAALPPAKDVRIEKVFPEEDPRLAGYEAFKETFGSDDVTALVAVELGGGSVLEPAAIARIRSLTAALAELELVDDRRLVSLSDATLVRVPDDVTLEVGPLYDPDDGWDAERVDRILAGHPGFEDRLVSRDRRLAAFWVPLVRHEPGREAEEEPPSEATRKRFAADLRAFFSPEGALEPGERAWLEGFAITNDRVLAMIDRDLQVFYPLAIGLVLVALGAVFRRVAPTLLAVATLALAAVWTLGLMAVLGYPLSFMSTAIPVMLLVVCTGDAVHLIGRFHQLLAAGQAKAAALDAAVREVGRACFYTSVTTAAGFASLSLSQVEIIRELGVPVAIGVFCAFGLTFLVMPPLLAVLPAPAPGAPQAGVGLLAGPLRRLSGLVERRAGTVLVVAGLVLAADLALLPWLSRETRLLQAFDAEAPIMRTRAFFEERLGGVAPLEVVIDAGEPGRAIEPDVQRGLLELSRTLRSESFREDGVLYALSLADFLADAYYTLNERRPEYAGTLPDTTEALAQLHLLYWGFAGSDPTVDLVDEVEAPRRLRVQLRVANLYTSDFFALVERVRSAAEEALPDDVDVEVTGFTLISQATHQSLVRDMSRSLGFAFASVGVLALLCFRSLRLAALALVPNLLPLLMVFGILVLSGTALSMSTSIVFSIVFGISVDDTIHFVAGLAHREGRPRAIARTIEETGLSLCLSTAVLVIGFSVLTLSEFPVNRTVGGVMAATAVLALLGDLFVLPALLVLVARRRPAA